ncbi:cytochrome P450 [Mycena leptocephala]|nr:cytochrome P450 [Mycena leptocephala]
MLFPSAHSAAVYATFGVALALYVLYCRPRRCKLRLPLGPKKRFFFGNLFDVPATFQWKVYKEWSEQLESDIIHLDLAGTPLIVLSSLETTESLLDKRSALYSDRPHLPMVMDLMGWDFTIGDEWRTHKRLLNKSFNITASRTYEPHELTVTRTLLQRLLDTPDDFLPHLRQMAGEFVMSMSYGIDVLPSNDPYIALARDAVHTFSVANTPGRYLVNQFPLLKHIPAWFPGAKFKRDPAEWRKLARGMIELPFSETKRQMQADTAQPSFTAESLRALAQDEGLYYQEHHVKATAGTIFFAGADTTVAALSTFILAMLANPEAQRIAQAEIDSVTEQTRLPTFEDRDSLPYIAALIKEVHRWEPVAPFALPRLLTTEDECRGYRLPAGSIILPNVWAILHDEPFKFKPERFLLPNGKPNPAVRDPLSAFGFGRRLCPGRHMAHSSLLIAITSILAAFNIEKAVDAEGRVVEPSYEYISGSICGPLPFECSITPRSEEAAALVRGG